MHASGKGRRPRGAAGRAGRRLREDAAPVWGTDPDFGDPVSEEAARLIERAHEALFEGRVAEAEYLMRRALAFGHFTAVYNNLALLQLEHHHRPDEALKLLRKNLDSPRVPWQPFTRAVAARCLLRMDRREEAREVLQQAIRDFEAGLNADINREPWARRAWSEYISKILEAAGELGDHRLVWNLYRRWRKHVVLNSSHALGGIAAFNLGRFRAAAEAWRLAQDEMRPFLRMYEAVAQWCDQGLIEPFPLDYGLGGPDPLHELIPFLMGVRPPLLAPVYLAEDGRPAVVTLNTLDEADDGPPGPDARVAARVLEDAPLDDDDLDDPERQEFTLSEEERAAERAAYLTRFAAAMQRPANRMLLIWMAFRYFLERRPPREKRPVFLRGVRELIAAGGDWGAATARRLFAAADIELDLKEAAARGLMDAGLLGEDATVHMWWNGRMQDVPFKAGELRVAEV